MKFPTQFPNLVPTGRKARILAGAGGIGALALVSAAALAAAPAGFHGPMAQFDADNDQKLTLAEIRRGAEAKFGEADTNKDGSISMEEARAHHAGHAGGHDGHRRGGHGHGEGPDDGHGEGGRVHMDKDGDGAVTLAEMQSEMEAHFAAADANHDGSITVAEMDAAHRARHEGR
jgi:hypothetical protein